LNRGREREQEKVFFSCCPSLSLPLLASQREEKKQPKLFHASCFTLRREGRKRPARSLFKEVVFLSSPFS